MFNHSLNHNYQIGRKQKIQNFKLKTREIEKLLSKWGTQQLMGDRGHKPCICPIAKQTQLLPNMQLSLLLLHFINTTTYHLARYQPSSHSRYLRAPAAYLWFNYKQCLLISGKTASKGYIKVIFSFLYAYCLLYVH